MVGFYGYFIEQCVFFIFSMWYMWLYASSLSMPIWQLALFLGDQMVMHVQA
jgi:hypothetical protein